MTKVSLSQKGLARRPFGLIDLALQDVLKSSNRLLSPQLLIQNHLEQIRRDYERVRPWLGHRDLLDVQASIEAAYRQVLKSNAALRGYSWPTKAQTKPGRSSSKPAAVQAAPVQAAPKRSVSFNRTMPTSYFVGLFEEAWEDEEG